MAFPIQPLPLFVPAVKSLKRRREDDTVIASPEKRSLSSAKKKILIYHDSGTYQQSIDAIYSQLQQTLTPEARIKLVNSDYLRNKAWEAKTAALIMGGGMCGEWDKSLQEDGVKKIHDYVFNGGKYLGICAGAYFAATSSHFSLLGKLPIEKSRPLRFFQGRAVGPIFPTADHLSPQAALAAKIDLATVSGHCYYQGGCLFDIQADSPLTKVIANYAYPYRGAAIISCKVGKGQAVLCGLHPEFLWNKSSLDSVTQPHFYQLVQKLSPEEPFRQLIWQEMLRELSVN